MPQIEVTSLDDPRLAPYRQLKETNATRREKLFVAEGAKLVRRLLDSDFETVSLLLGQSFVPEFVDAPSLVPLYVVPDDWVEQIIGFNFHRGVLACGRRRPAADLESLCGRLSERATLAICPDVQDPENLGVILRIASAFGIDAVILGDKTADPFSRRVLRVSMGASFRLPIIMSADLSRDLPQLQQRWNFELWATVLDDDATPLVEIPRPPRLALLFGSEGHGLPRDLVDLCDHLVTILIAKGVDSLNVAIAAGIFLHEVTRH